MGLFGLVWSTSPHRLDTSAVMPLVAQIVAMRSGLAKPANWSAAGVDLVNRVSQLIAALERQLRAEAAKQHDHSRS